MDTLIRSIEKEYLADKNVEFNTGDTIAVSLKIQEGGKTRVQNFQGVVIQQSGSGTSKTVTVRKVSSNNIYVEKIFPIFSPLVSEIKRIRMGRVRRSRIFYLRSRTGKATRIKERKK